MVVISSQYKVISDYLGIQKYDFWRNYIESPYIVKAETDDGILWHNMLTREIILIENSDMKFLESRNNIFMTRLVEKWFFIPDNIDPKTINYMLWSNYFSKHPYKKTKLNLVTIFTTTECNARCYYCYEYGVTKNTMSEKTAIKVADYIIKNANNNVTLKWFGGEPLVNFKVMDIISQRILNSGLLYKSYIISNAYLLDKVSDYQLTELWKIYEVQITIDGTENEYKKVKQLPDDAYTKLFETIKRLCFLNIEVSIRIHVTNDNYDDLKLLILELYNKLENIANKHLINVYVVPLFEGLGKCKILNTYEKKDLYDKYTELDEMTFNLGLKHRYGLGIFQAYHCMADNGSSIVVTPTGELTLCEHCSDKEIIGTVDDDYNKLNFPSKWSERYDEIPECSSCFYYPQCFKLKMCEPENDCDENYRKYMKHTKETVIKKIYSKYKDKNTKKINI